MYSFESRLDRDVARELLHAPTDSISYRPMLMRKEQNQLVQMPSQGVDHREDLGEDWIPAPHPNAQLGYPTNTNIAPMYYDVIIDTVTDYDIFYPIAKHTRKYYYDSNETADRSRYHTQRSDELAVSIDFPHDFDPITNHPDDPPETQSVPYADLQPMKNVRFDDSPTWIPSSQRAIQYPSISNEPYRSPPGAHLRSSYQPSSVRYITTPFFWFRPVVNHNYAICIPTSRPSLHAYITTTSDPNMFPSTPNPIRL